MRLKQTILEHCNDGITSIDQIRHILTSLGMKSSDVECLIVSSGALSNGQLDVEKFLASLDNGVGSSQKASGECRFRIFHINDCYLLDNFPALKTCIDKMSEGLPKSNVLTTLAGDFLAPSLLSSIDHGHGMVDVMNSIPIDAVCFGNHECDVPHQALLSRIKEYKGKWLNSNMRSFNETEPIPPGALPDNHVIQLEGGRSVALIGLCCGGGKSASLYREGAFGGHAAKITPVLDAVDDAIARARAAYPNVDCVIPLTHQDMPDDVKMCECDIPAVLGGHDHGVFNEVHNGTLLIKAGEDAFKVAVIDIVWAADAPASPAPPTSVSVELVQLSQPRRHKGPPMELKYEPDPKVLQLVKKWQQPAEDLKSAVLARMPPGKYSSVGVRKGENSMATLICNALEDVSDCDGAIINAGGVRGNKSYDDGLIGFADINAECPFPSANIVVQIEGAALSAGIAHSRQPWKGGAGGRGEAGASGDALHCDDKMKVDPDTLAVLEVDGKPLIPDKIYDILIDSYLMQSNPVFKEYSDKYPERIPPDDSGQPALPLLVQYFCDKIWLDLIDLKGDGQVDLAAIDHFFDQADTDKSGDIDEDKLLAVLRERTNNCPGVARVIASQCISFADTNKNGKVSKAELQVFFQAEIKEHMHPEHKHKHDHPDNQVPHI